MLTRVACVKGQLGCRPFVFFFFCEFAFFCKKCHIHFDQEIDIIKRHKMAIKGTLNSL